MNSKLYVGNLPYQIEKTELENLFSTIGEVKSVNIIMDKMTGRAKGFGFVEMMNADDAQQASETLNGKEVGGRSIKVDLAKEEEPRRGPRNRY